MDNRQTLFLIFPLLAIHLKICHLMQANRGTTSMDRGFQSTTSMDRGFQGATSMDKRSSFRPRARGTIFMGNRQTPFLLPFLIIHLKKCHDNSSVWELLVDNVY